MKRIAILAVAAAFVTVTASASGTPARSSAGAQLQSVIVTLRSQADLSGIQGSRATRLREVILRRQAKAGEGQRLFAALFQAWQGSGVVTRVTPLWVINGFAITARPEVIKILAQSPAVASVTPDETMYAPSAAASAAAAEWNVSRVNAPALWDLGVTGQGVVVATLDSGVDVTHADLSGRWRGGTNSWYDPFGQHTTSPMDRTGHGTQVMGLMVGGDAGGTSVGVAPGARWIAARIYNDAGQGTTSNTHLAFQWLLDPDHNPNTADAPQVVNNSWTYGSGCNLTFAQDIQTLRAAGILPVFAAGNSASLTSSPANNPGAMAVGSTTSSDTIASYSSRGPSACGEPSNTFPELTAPGDNVRTTDLYGGYATFSGTSMAAPHVAGALALLLSAYPNLTAAQQENALELGAHDLGTAGPDNTFGYGRLDVLAAYNALSSPNFSLSVAPSSVSAAAGATATYAVSVNPSGGFAGDVALSLTGLSASQASWTFTPAAVTGGSGSSQLAITTSASLAVGSYPLTITGTSGSLTHTVSATLVVSPPPDFGVVVAPSSASTAAGGAVAYSVVASSQGGFAGDISLFTRSGSRRTGDLVVRPVDRDRRLRQLAADDNDVGVARGRQLSADDHRNERIRDAHDERHARRAAFRLRGERVAVVGVDDGRRSGVVHGLRVVAERLCRRGLALAGRADGGAGELVVHACDLDGRRGYVPADDHDGGHARCGELPPHDHRDERLDDTHDDRDARRRAASRLRRERVAVVGVHDGRRSGVVHGLRVVAERFRRRGLAVARRVDGDAGELVVHTGCRDGRVGQLAARDHDVGIACGRQLPAHDHGNEWFADAHGERDAGRVVTSRLRSKCVAVVGVHDGRRSGVVHGLRVVAERLCRRGLALARRVDGGAGELDVHPRDRDGRCGFVAAEDHQLGLARDRQLSAHDHRHERLEVPHGGGDPRSQPSRRLHARRLAVQPHREARRSGLVRRHGVVRRWVLERGQHVGLRASERRQRLVLAEPGHADRSVHARRAGTIVGTNRNVHNHDQRHRRLQDAHRHGNAPGDDMREEAAAGADDLGIE